MSRLLKISLALGVALVALLIVNAVVVGNQVKRAAITVEGAEIVETSAVDLQVLDQPAQDAKRQGAPIVLLHCYACSMRWWDALAPLLETRHRVVRIDLSGHGGSAKPKSGYTIDEQANAVAEALNQLGVQGATVIGHSMGGVVAVALAERASQLVDRVAVIGTPPNDETSELPLLARLGRSPLIGEAIWRLRFGAVVKSGYESAFAPDFDFEAAFTDPDQVVDDNEAMTFTSYEEASAGSGDFLSAQSLSSRITGTGVPLLAILGSEDQIVDTPAAAENYETAPGATVRVLEGIGHSPNLEAPADTAELLLRFAGAAPPPPPLPAPGDGGADQRGRGAGSGKADGPTSGSGRRKARSGNERSSRSGGRKAGSKPKGSGSRKGAGKRRSSGRRNARGR